jgi:hypothetical protein
MVGAVLDTIFQATRATVPSISEVMQPRRIQLKRAKGWRIPPNTIKVDRSTQWGNPFKVGEEHVHPLKKVRVVIDGKTSAVNAFRAYLSTAAGKVLAAKARIELRGRNLACWCKEGDLCHADVLLSAANR